MHRDPSHPEAGGGEDFCGSLGSEGPEEVQAEAEGLRVGAGAANRCVASGVLFRFLCCEGEVVHRHGLVKSKRDGRAGQHRCRWHSAWKA